MISFLDTSNDPTLRLACRSWLSQGAKHYKRILDPIFEDFIKNSNFKINEYGCIVIDQKLGFDDDDVIGNFGKLRNIILNTQDDIINYM